MCSPRSDVSEALNDNFGVEEAVVYSSFVLDFLVSEEFTDGKLNTQTGGFIATANSALCHWLTRNSGHPIDIRIHELSISVLYLKNITISCTFILAYPRRFSWAGTEIGSWNIYSWPHKVSLIQFLSVSASDPF